MNKTLKKTAVILCVGMISLGSQVCVTFAAEGSQDVIVSYSPTEEALARYKMQVDIIGNGSVLDGTQELRNNSSIYELKFEEKKTFQVSPDEGYHLKSIIFNGKDITHLLNEDGTITVEGMNYDTILIFTYEQNMAVNPDKSNGDSGQNKGPNTGVSGNSELLMSTALLSGAGLFYVLYKKKKNDEEEIEE